MRAYSAPIEPIFVFLLGGCNYISIFSTPVSPPKEYTVTSFHYFLELLLLA